MGTVVYFPRRNHAGTSACGKTSGKSGKKSSAETRPPDTALKRAAKSQDGLLTPRRMRLTVTRSASTIAATASSSNDSSRIQSASFMSADVHHTHNSDKGECTSGVVELGISLVHDVYMHRRTAKKVISRLKPEPRFGMTFIKNWRKHRGLTQQQLADRIGTTHATIQRVENGKTPYNQPMLEALADALQTEPASLLMRDPTAPDAIWSIWDRAKPKQREQIVRLAQTLLETGT